MEKLTIALPLEGLDAFGYGFFHKDVETLASYTLRMDAESMTLVKRVRPRRKDLLPEEWLADPVFKEGKFLRKEGEEWVVLTTLSVTPAMHKVFDPFPDIILGPFSEARGKKLLTTLVGERARLQEFLDFARGMGIPFEAVRFEPLDARAVQFLEDLTPKQRETLQAAYALGYYETPRRVTLRELARMAHRDPSSVMALLRRANRKLLESAFG